MTQFGTLTGQYRSTTMTRSLLQEAENHHLYLVTWVTGSQ